PPSNTIELTVNNLTPGETYYLMFNPNLIPVNYGEVVKKLVDYRGNDFYPISKKFSTVTNAVKNYPINGYNVDDMNNLQQQPHGNYNNNVNNCGICHNTHTAINNGLVGNNVENGYCMACHDGTITSPIKDSESIRNKHDAQIVENHNTSASSCTSCHNPHLSWSDENPNLLKDHYVYKHEAGDNWEGSSVGTVDSSIQLCELCHGRYTYLYKKRAEDAGGYTVMHYRKQNIAKGDIKERELVSGDPTSKILEVDDYNLCFSCHANGTKVKNAKNILSLYTNGQSKHFITAIDGSNLNGQIPCAECHETHGSTNQLLLKTKLGHENQDTNFTFTSNDGDWSLQKEQQFCVKCHNGSTSIFGVTGKALDITKTPEHDIATSTKFCSECHGGNTGTPQEKTLRAAHSPN
ncbi:cytochrome c3 family protein, partial [Neobacillus drentensis]|uniref:cytochrome c3 family protein n=1 Tax=Neobacillus drentensis TaxID=220684 RepID=UPI003000DEC1